MSVISALQLQDRLQYTFQDSKLLAQALTHKSYHHENIGQSQGDNERLEFLGDAVLDLSLSALLMAAFPGDTEGSLSKKRASLVNVEILAQVARELKLEEELRLGRGERITGGLEKPRLLASALEAIIGAVFQDAGFQAADSMIARLFERRVADLASVPDFILDYKTRLQEKMQEVHRMTPTYRLESEAGPDHDKQFEVSVLLKDRVLAAGRGRSKKAAEQDAARKALEKIV